MLFSVASSPTTPSWDVAVKTALDLAILGIGATAAIFENPILVEIFKEHAAEVGIGVIAVDLFILCLDSPDTALRFCHNVSQIAMGCRRDDFRNIGPSDDK